MTDREKLEEWNKYSLFGGATRQAKGEGREEILRACLSYMISRLSHRQIPRLEPVRDTLNGKVPVPPCGVIGCAWDAPDHVH